MRGREDAQAAASLGEAVKGLRQLVAQGQAQARVQEQALPRAAERLDESARQLSALGGTLEQVSADVVSALRESLLEIRADMKGAVEETGVVTRQALQPALEAGVERTVTIAGERIEALADTLREHLDARRDAEAAMIERLDARAAALAEGLADQQRAFAEQLASGVHERTETLLARLEDAAGALREAGREQQAALAMAVESAEARVAGLEAETGRRLHALFDALEQGATRQAEALAGFEQRLDAQRAAEARALRESLAEQGADLAGRLGTAGEQVREAAALVKAGGAELSALAEAFGQSVDRHRDASVAWLERLGDEEGAVERTGRAAAADALAAQLAATEEVLARQLDVQRELFAQLRALRGGGSIDEASDGDASGVDAASEGETSDTAGEEPDDDAS